MKLTVALLTFWLIGLEATITTRPQDAITVKPCPTITSTTKYCSSCRVPACLGLKTITQKCDCPSPVPTKYTTQDCDVKCPIGCYGTSYIFEPPPTKCRTSTTTTTSKDDPSSCVPTVTVTTRPGIEGGCKFNCSTDFCIIDQFVTLPCGCTTAPGVVTETVTVCATNSPCWNCHTGFPFTTTRTDCPKQT